MPVATSVDDECLDRAFRALSAGGRRSIVRRLSRGPASVGELAEPLAMSLPAVMQHLDVLQREGMVSTEKVGRVRTCRLEPQQLGPVEAWLRDNRAAWETRLDRLGDLLDEPGPGER